METLRAPGGKGVRAVLDFRPPGPGSARHLARRSLADGASGPSHDRLGSDDAKARRLRRFHSQLEYSPRGIGGFAMRIMSFVKILVVTLAFVSAAALPWSVPAASAKT